jgi:DNA repair photolyase
MPAQAGSRSEDSPVVRNVECKSILTRSGIEGIDYALNPYVGCAHACLYCYAVFMKRFTGHQEEWGTFVDVKINAPQVLSRQLGRARPGNISFGTVTDAYQPLERAYKLTRACLEVLVGQDRDFPVSILTKSDLVLRDLDLLRKLKDVEVAFTITSPDDAVSRLFEPGSSPARQRLEALRSLHEAGIATWAFCGPVLPAITDEESSLEALFLELKRAGVGHVLVDSLNLRGAVWGRLARVLEKYYPHLIPTYRALSANRLPYHQALLEKTRRLADKHDLPWRGVELSHA